MIGDLWVLVTLLETPAREGAPVEEPRMLALTEAETAEADRVDGLVPVDRVEWDAWRAAAAAYQATIADAGRLLTLAERRAHRAAARLLPGARRRAARAAESGVETAAVQYAAAVRSATTGYWPIHCEIRRRLDSQTAAGRWVEIRSRFAGRGTEPVWGWSLREIDPEETPGLVELTVFRWDGDPPAGPADLVSPDRFGAPDLDRELLRLRAEWTVRRIVWDEPARLRVEQENGGVPFALWWRAVTARVDAAEKVIPPRSADGTFSAAPAATRHRRIEVLQLPE
ncbi:hypothetical protein DN069_04940 [Streptacidiphilus pinicola]|uniref:Uncharacterized protein n=1 Tax=Streptacidiphilus pinicola TaxID=2219663 RepID=A0A2X0ITT6_9ACTN|nr:hypothetical protein [Streptacidiphilus pinicola]RAG86741.1 hypothetical protein DN069_04940 [Streptacidiphilus pinicola]